MGDQIIYAKKLLLVLLLKSRWCSIWQSFHMVQSIQRLQINSEQFVILMSVYAPALLNPQDEVNSFHRALRTILRNVEKMKNLHF